MNAIAKDIHDITVALTKAKDPVFTRDEDGFATVTFKIKGDALYSLLKLIKQCSYMGDIGHSFNIDIDPKGGKDYKRTVGFDGDGSDRIKDIMVNGEPLPDKFQW